MYSGPRRQARRLEGGVYAGEGFVSQVQWGSEPWNSFHFQTPACSSKTPVRR